MESRANFTQSQITSFHKNLHKWYKIHGRRDLPWRNTRDPYAIYLSEIMLQQTQVKTVLERYYTPFLQAFPTLKALAQAEREAVVKQWEGLGYYIRAANFHAAARQCSGILPGTAEELHALPGIGRNTANAVACFAFKQPVPVMEANVRRVLCRVFAMQKADENILWEKAELLLDKDNPFDYNQAMMDIGSLVCTKRTPRCDSCPLNMICQGKASPALYPAPKLAKTVPMRHRIITVLKDSGEGYYLHKRDTRFLNGLYGFPEHPAESTEVTYGKVHYPLDKKRIIGQVTQTYSHFTLQATVYLLPVNKALSGLHRATLQEIKKLPLSRADHKILAMLA